MSRRRRARRPIPGARFVDPTILARIGNLELLARTVVDGFINGLHRAPYLRRVDRLRRAPRLRAGDDIRRVDWRLYARTDRYYVKQYEADTNTNFSVLLDVSKSMSFASRGVSKLEYAQLPRARASPTSRTGSATASASSPSTATSSTHVPPSAKHFNVVLHTLDRAQGRAARATWPRRCSKMAEHFKRRGILRADLGLLRGARRDPRGDQAAAVPRQRPDRLPRARSGGDRLRLRRRVELRGSRERRADAGRARVVRRRVPDADPRAHRRARRRSSRSTGSTTRCSTRRSRSTARSSAICRAASG